MLIFIDESGDTGLKTDKGSSSHFILVAVVFYNNDEADFCDKAIDNLKKKISWSSDSEFHFKNNSDKIRELFLKTISVYNFNYYKIIIDKKKERFLAKNKVDFYFYAYKKLFEDLFNILDKAVILIDKNSNKSFSLSLEKYLKSVCNSKSLVKIKKLKSQDSKKNNLLQLADYIAGAINRSTQLEKKNKNEYLKIISSHELKSSKICK